MGVRFSSSGGAYPVSIGLHDYKESLKTHIEILKHGRSVYIFPQSARVAPNGRYIVDGGEVTIKGGVVFLSHITHKPIVPVHIQGLYDMTWKEFLLRKRHIKITFGKPLFVKDLFENAQNISIEDYKKRRREGNG